MSIRMIASSKSTVFPLPVGARAGINEDIEIVNSKHTADNLESRSSDSLINDDSKDTYHIRIAVHKL